MTRLLRNVLVAVDVTGDDFPPEGGPTSWAQALVDAARWTHDAAGCSLTVIGVVPEEATESENELIREAARHRVAERVLPLLGLDDVDVVIASGVAYVEIGRHALRTRPDLLVIGPRRAHVGQRRIVGSQAMNLLRTCPCPVWVAPRRFDRGPRAVLSAVGLHELTPRILAVSAELVAAADATWHVLYVPEYPSEGGMRLRGCSAEEVADYERDTRKGAWSELHGWCDPLAETAGRRAQLWMAEGTPSERIGATCHELGIDVVVMGTQGRRGLAGILLGNTADKVFSATEVSILAVKPEDFVSPITLDG